MKGNWIWLQGASSKSLRLSLTQQPKCMINTMSWVMYYSIMSNVTFFSIMSSSVMFFSIMCSVIFNCIMSNVVYYCIMSSVIYYSVMSSLVWFGLVWFYGISTIVGYLMPNPCDTYIKYVLCKHILLITFLDELVLLFCSQLNDFKYCIVTVTI